MRKMHILNSVLFIVVLSVTCYFVIQGYLKQRNDLRPTTFVTEVSNCEIINYHNGIYYFDCIEADFGNSLSIFLGNKDLLSITSDNTGLYGRTIGYFVVINGERGK